MSKRLKVAIVGIGGVGGYIAYRLLEANLADVTLIAKEETVDAITKSGLTLKDIDNESTIHDVYITTNPSDTYDVVIISTKSYDFASACEVIKDSCTKDTLIIPISNGVGHNESINRLLNRDDTAQGCIYIVSHLEKRGVIKRKADTFYMIFGSEIITEKMQEFADILNKSNLKTKLTEDIEYQCWKKYLFISSMASATSYYKQPMGYIVQNHLDILKSLLMEIKDVANALNIAISEDDIDKCIKQAQNVPYESKTSMQLDFENTKETELESLSGYIVQKAKYLDIDVPTMKMVYNELKK
jgi:2-dehydropantoate 2-reductase